MQRHEYAHLVVYITILVPLLTGCIIPVPMGSDVTQSDLWKIKPGYTSRYEIERQLGEPNVLDESGFAVYTLDEGKMEWIVFPLGIINKSEKVYNIGISYDPKGIVKELSYNQTSDDRDLIILEEYFPDRSVDFAKKDNYYTMDISRDGSWITAVSADRFVFHEVGGEHKEIEREKKNFPSSSDSIECLLKLNSIHAQKQNVEYEWMFDKEDITPFYRLCKPFGAIAISEDGNLIAVADMRNLELWSLDRGYVQGRVLEEGPISGIGLIPQNNLVITFGGKTGSRFSTKPTYSNKLNLRAPTRLNLIAQFNRKSSITGVAISRDGKLFALATPTHIELWERVENCAAPHSISWPYKLKRLILKPATYYPMGGQFSAYFGAVDTLRFSTDGKYLMNVETLLQVWDTRSGRLLARIGSDTGLISAAFHKDKEIVVIRGSRNISWRSPFIPRYKHVKLWRLPLDTVIRQYGYTGGAANIVSAPNLGLQPSIGNETTETCDDS